MELVEVDDWSERNEVVRRSDQPLLKTRLIRPVGRRAAADVQVVEVLIEAGVPLRTPRTRALIVIAAE